MFSGELLSSWSPHVRSFSFGFDLASQSWMTGNGELGEAANEDFGKRNLTIMQNRFYALQLWLTTFVTWVVPLWSILVCIYKSLLETSYEMFRTVITWKCISPFQFAMIATYYCGQNIPWHPQGGENPSFSQRYDILTSCLTKLYRTSLLR